MPCSQLLSQDFTNVPGAPPASLTSATVVGSGNAAYCDVGSVSPAAPQTQFELRLPGV